VGLPASARSGHIEPASVKRQHLHACEGRENELKNAQRKEGGPKKWSVELFPLYPWALAYLAGHRDMSITKRYIHPQEGTLRDAIEKARVAKGGHTSGHTAPTSQIDVAMETVPLA